MSVEIAWLRNRLWKCNPLYLLSAVCALTGGWLLRTDLAARGDPWTEVLALIGVFQAYEWAVLGLAVWLVRTRPDFRDGWELQVLAAVFLVDAVFLNQMLLAGRFEAGALVAAGMLVSSAAKLYVVQTAGRVPMTAAQQRFVALSLAVLYLGPAALEAVGPADPALPLWMFAGWWVIGLLAGLIPPEWDAPPETAGHESRTARLGSATVRAFLTGLPVASAAAHLAALHWTYEVPLPAAAAAPLLLGLAFALGRIPAVRARPRLWQAVRLAPAAAAVAASANAAESLWVALPGTGETLSPFRAALVAAAGLWLWTFAERSSRAFAYLAGGAMMLAAAGHSPEAVRSNVLALAAALRGFTPRQWGLTALASAFALLAAGAAVSGLRRREPSRPAEPRLADWTGEPAD